MKENNSVTTDVNVYVDRQNEAVVVFGQLNALFEAYRAHRLSLGQNIDPVIEANMEVALSAALLHLASQPPDLFSAWTINMQNPLANYFIAGTNSDKTIVGRVFTEEVKTSSSGAGKVFLQISRPYMAPSMSAVEVNSSDMIAAMEEFFNRSLQIPTRFFETATGEFTFIQGLPLVKKEWIMGLTRAAAADYIKGNTLELVEERHYTFKCGCTEEMILNMLYGQYHEDAEALFMGDKYVEVTCPRCGDVWKISAESFVKFALSQNTAKK